MNFNSLVYPAPEASINGKQFLKGLESDPEFITVPVTASMLRAAENVTTREQIPKLKKESTLALLKNKLESPFQHIPCVYLNIDN